MDSFNKSRLRLPQAQTQPMDYGKLCDEYLEKYKKKKLTMHKSDFYILRKNGEDYSLMTEIVLYTVINT